MQTLKDCTFIKQKNVYILFVLDFETTQMSQVIIIKIESNEIALLLLCHYTNSEVLIFLL